MNGEKGLGNRMLPARLDNDDDDIYTTSQKYLATFENFYFSF